MKKIINIILYLFILFSISSLVFAEGRTYQHNEKNTHCTLWDNLRLKWPQTSMGQETQKCRRRAIQPTKLATTCRLTRQFFDSETGSRICVYKKQGVDGEKSVSLSPSLKCQRQYTCRADD